MEPKIESAVSYDERRKELTHKTSETKEAKIGEEVIGEVSISSKGVYNEAGIRNILKDLESRKEILEKNIITLKELQGPVHDLEIEPELKKLKENLKDLQLIDHQEKASPEDLKKEADDLKNNEEDLKKVNKDIKDIKDSIGTRLNL